MNEEASVSDMLRTKGFRVVGSVVKDGLSGSKFFCFIEVERDARNRQIPSNQKLDLAKEEISLLGQDIEFILLDNQSRDLELAVRATMLHSHGDYIRNSFLSIDEGFATVWLVPKKQIDSAIKKAITDRLLILIEGFELTIAEIHFTADENTPTKYACLSTLRIIAPASAESLRTALHEKGFTVPSIRWVVHKLDALRKAHQVVRMKSGVYALTLTAIKTLGTKKNARSPDITRLLALARQPR